MNKMDVEFHENYNHIKKEDDILAVKMDSIFHIIQTNQVKFFKLNIRIIFLKKSLF